MIKTDNVELLSQQIAKIRNSGTWSAYQKNKLYFECFTLILEEATKDERLNFTTLFSRLAYTGTKFQLRNSTLHYSHIFRKLNEQGNNSTCPEQILTELGNLVCSLLLHEIFKVPTGSLDLIPTEPINAYFKRDKKQTIGYKPVIEGLLYEIDVQNKRLHFFDEEDPTTEKTALYDVHDKNELFTANIESLVKSGRLPVHINLIDTDIRDDEVYIPMAFIIQPDHLIDVTSISECFKDFGAEPFLYLVSKFKAAEATASLMTGNLVNFMLDEIISDSDISFKLLLPALFQSNPLGFAMLDDHSTKDMINILHAHFNNLKYAVKQEFKNFNISRNNLFLEPSFYSRDYGIQGRLDLLHQNEGSSISDIIELKSGKIFKPNVYGINASHYVQTLLYDLIIRSTFKTRTKSFNYILYSKEKEKPMRFAPPVRAQQYEAMKLRNDIIAIEDKIRKTDQNNAILDYVKPENFKKLKGFNSKDIENFYNIYSTLDDFEKAYFDEFCAFIAREHSLLKTGEHGINKSNGNASLWLESEEEKRDRFSILTKLTISENKSNESDPYITFTRNTDDDSLVNFRSGDIVVLYPVEFSNENRVVLKNQIFKCTITEISAASVTIRLRNKQFNQHLFLSKLMWNIEPDTLDSGINSMYKGLFAWAASSKEYRSLILGISSPATNASIQHLPFESEMTEQQAVLLKKIISAKNYFLLWGPPGTGKTSIMLKYLVRYLHECTNENILLLAYTNRAVDEICDAVVSIGQEYKHQYLRLGSRIGTHANFTENLLDQVIKTVKSRQDILMTLHTKRIYISTVSSIAGKVELFNLKEFDTVIIDEASQILEPMLIGLLPKFKRFILIGDHKQLPAVVVQDKTSSAIHKPELINAGIYDTRNSLFERLYLQAVRQNRSTIFGILEQQGRMHPELMGFPNQYFYENKLQLLPGLKRQREMVLYKETEPDTAYLENRTIFINTEADDEVNWKTNKYEANQCLQVIHDLLKIFELNHKVMTNDSIGIITPYRAQIALINSYLEHRLPSEIKEKITVDTVERYQGGARDIIIISCCVNRLSQLDTLISLSEEGVDRKLNVALTRAKEQIILIGNKGLLTDNTIYSDLIKSYKNFEAK